VSTAYLKGLIRHNLRQTGEKLKKHKVSDDMDGQSKATYPDKNTESLKTFASIALM
jgi:hypothetical protein